VSIDGTNDGCGAKAMFSQVLGSPITMDNEGWTARELREAKARIRELQAALAFWMPDEGIVPADCQATWDKHIELLPPAGDRIGAALDRGLALETKP